VTLAGQSKIDDLTLLRYFEDDLTPEQRSVVEVAMKDDPSAQERLHMLAETGQILRAAFAGFDSEEMKLPQPGSKLLGAFLTGTKKKSVRLMELLSAGRNAPTRKKILIWGGAVVVPLLVIAVSVSTFRLAATSEPTMVAEDVPASQDTASPNGKRFASNKVPADEIIKLLEDPRLVLDLLGDLPKNWRSEVFDADPGMARSYAVGDDVTIRLRLEGPATAPSGLECRVSSFEVEPGPEPVRGLRACIAEGEDWDIAEIEIVEDYSSPPSAVQ
jgi:hypothetical protein